jgi:hypothetical protein
MRLAGFASKRVMLLLRSTALQQGHKQHSHLLNETGWFCQQKGDASSAQHRPAAGA